MGNDSDVQDLAQLYLGRRDLQAMRQRLLEGQSVPNRDFRIYIGQVGNNTRLEMSVLGTTFNAEIATSQQPSHIFISELTPHTLKVELLPIHLERFPGLNLPTLLKQSTKEILHGLYEIDTSSLDRTWGDLRQSDQLDIQVAKDFLLEGAPYIMRMLGAHERIPAIKNLLTQWDNLRHQKAELKQQKTIENEKSIENLDKQIDELIKELSTLLEGDADENKQIRKNLLQAVRTKIDLHGYRPQSIPFELFQNADDAVIEWMQMSPMHNLDEARTQFIVVETGNKLLFIHAGRPIGCFQHPEFPKQQYRDRGFDRDLEKMLTFNISDKGESVTGKFGLGFKSVYLVCDRPLVMSKNLGFAVEGGLIPSRLNLPQTKELRERLQSYINLADATVVELELAEGCYSEDIMQHFLELTSILLVFSRAIKRCKIIKASSQTVDLFWGAQSIPNVRGVEVGEYWGRNDSTLICLRTEGDAEAALLLGITEQNGRLKGLLPDNLPTFWVTAPTREKLTFGFALNANFDITTGRESLVKSSARNNELADRIGVALGEVLCSLSRASQENWHIVAETLGIMTVDKYEFWSFLWQELAVRWQKKNSSEGREIISRILGGDRGMGYLINHCKALPSGLYGGYRKLLLMSEVRYRVTGKLLEQDCFLEVAN